MRIIKFRGKIKNDFSTASAEMIFFKGMDFYVNSNIHDKNK